MRVYGRPPQFEVANQPTLLLRIVNPHIGWGKQGGNIGEHRGVEYEITKAENQWLWTINPEERTSKTRSTVFTYSTKREADAACRTEIDRGLVPVGPKDQRRLAMHLP